MTTAISEIQTGQRFEFGGNWARFLSVIDESRIVRAERSLCSMLEVKTLRGLTFLDVGSGSGIMSLAARRLGAAVHSFDYDPKSVACSAELRRRYSSDDPLWKVEEGSILNPSYIRALGQFDVVYAWGVLHHTGNMLAALANVASLVRDGGKLFIAIYNDQGGASRRWAAVKRFYNRAPAIARLPILLCFAAFFESRAATVRLFQLKNPLPFAAWKARKQERGMSMWHDLVDWIGGYPFEVAKPEQIFDFFAQRGFILTRLTTCAGGLGCNEFVFAKRAG